MGIQQDIDIIVSNYLTFDYVNNLTTVARGRRERNEREATISLDGDSIPSLEAFADGVLQDILDTNTILALYELASANPRISKPGLTGNGVADLVSLRDESRKLYDQVILTIGNLRSRNAHLRSKGS